MIVRIPFYNICVSNRKSLEADVKNVILSHVLFFFSCLVAKLDSKSENFLTRLPWTPFICDSSSKGTQQLKLNILHWATLTPN